MTKNEYDSTVFSVDHHEVFQVNIRLMINCNLSKLSFVWNLHDEKKLCLDLNPLITESVIV